MSGLLQLLHELSQLLEGRRPLVAPMLPMGMFSSSAISLYGSSLFGHQQAQETLARGGSRSAAIRTGSDLLFFQQSGIERICCVVCDEVDLVGGGDRGSPGGDPGASPARGGGQPGTESFGLLNAVDVLDEPKPRGLRDFGDVRVVQTTPSGNRSNQATETLDEALPGFARSGPSLQHDLGQLVFLGKRPVSDGTPSSLATSLHHFLDCHKDPPYCELPVSPRPVATGWPPTRQRCPLT